MAYNVDNITAVVDLIASTAASPRDDSGEVEDELLWSIFQVLHTMLTVVALGNNCFSLVVIYGVVARLTPPLQLLTSLAFSDMLAPWAVMTMYFPESACQEEIHSALLLTAHNSAALGLAVLALAHNIATFHPLQYDRIITQKRIWITINLVWIAAILTAHMHFLATLAHHDPNVSFCVNVQNNMGMALVMAAACCGALALVAACIYGRMLLHLRPLEIAMSGPATANNTAAESRKSTRSVVTGIILAAVHVACWGPYLVTKFLHAADYASPARSVLVANAVCQAAVLLSCSADPVVYGLRMTNMQTGYHRLYQRARGWCTVTWTRIASHAAAAADNDHPATPLNPIESIC